MKKVLVFDIESNGLELDKITKLHCVVVKDIILKKSYRLYNNSINIITKNNDLSLSYKDMVDVFSNSDIIIGHNIIKYDIGVLGKFFGEDFENSLKKTKIIDTLVWSQTLNPDRQLPKGCPTSIYNPVTGLNDKITPHSVAAWAYRVSKIKPVIHEWEDFTESILNRCEEDVEIQELILYALLKEAGLTLEEF